jgi:hypothetical protein
MAMRDRDLMPWIDEGRSPEPHEEARLRAIVQDRLASSLAEAVIRNAQERRQLTVVAATLENAGYRRAPDHVQLLDLNPGTYATSRSIITPKGKVQIDCGVMPHRATPGSLPVAYEAKSAGDLTNTNKRRKEEIERNAKLQAEFPGIRFVLFLGGYFDETFFHHLYRAGVACTWEHRPEDVLAYL